MAALGILAPVDQPDRGSYLTNFGTEMLKRFELAGSMSDLDTAVGAYQEVLLMLGPDHPKRPACLSDLSNAYVLDSNKLGRSTTWIRPLERSKNLFSSPGERPTVLGLCATSALCYNVNLE